jgi:hypothetical protein
MKEKAGVYLKCSQKMSAKCCHGCHGAKTIWRKKARFRVVSFLKKGM